MSASLYVSAKVEISAPAMENRNIDDEAWRRLLTNSEQDSDDIYEKPSRDLFLYESKRAGQGTKNNNTLSGIRDVQVHKTQPGKETRVETELQSHVVGTELNINVIMDSDSNMSNVIGNSLEFDTQLGTTEVSPTDDSESSSTQVGASDDRSVSNLAADQTKGGDPAKPSPQLPDSDTNSDDGEGEGEGDMDEAMKHYQCYLDGEKVDDLRGPNKESNENKATATLKKLPTGHLEKEGVVIGCMSVYADVHIKEFIVMLSDDIIQAFIVDPGRFRSVANRTKCEIEMTRRILNRRMGKYRWLKYLVVIIRGPSNSSIDQCDKMMSAMFPPYKWRKPYGIPAIVSMFLKESTPDNTDLYFNYQRTGSCHRMFGEISLRAPFRTTKLRPVEQTPWKIMQKRQRWGVLEPINDRMERVLSYVYPERGGTTTQPMDGSFKWADAALKAVEMRMARDLARSQIMQNRRMESKPLYARVVGE